MHRFKLQALMLGLIAGALLWGPGLDVLQAEDEAPEEAPAEAEGIQWVKGWAAGQAQAKKDGRLIFLYFGRYTPK